ncbi:hypothetical protein ACNUDN_22450 [Mycobacterium sp. smrl_JER01]|uniref:hypothetical protein n=1 Tax=Mycobacterium sp. smrl_JER01 TaxID=3402633 RepID=UPI003ABE2942
MGFEIVGGQMEKSARTERNRTPFEILADLASSVDARGFGVRTPRHWSVVEAGQGDWAVIDSDSGEVVSVTPPGEWAVWHEWEQASKGRRQLLWSRKRKEPSSKREVLWNTLLSARGCTAEQSDEAVAATDAGGETVGEISRADWYKVVVWRPELMADLLQMAERGDVSELAEALEAVGATLNRPPPPKTALRQRLCLP